MRSIFYNVYQEDIYQLLEDSIGIYSDQGNVFVMGDLNSRTGRGADFNLSDNLHEDIHRAIDDVIVYNEDIPDNIRNSEDSEVNTFGRSLFQLCKTTDLIILNGHTNGDYEGKLTFYSSLGTSVIDYALACNHGQTKVLIECFEVGGYNMHSDHAPIFYH